MWSPPADLFQVLMCYFLVGGAKSVADIDTGGAKILTFRQIHNAIITLSVPEVGSLLLLFPRGAKLHCQLLWGAMAGFAPPLNPPLVVPNGLTPHILEFAILVFLSSTYYFPFPPSLRSSHFRNFIHFLILIIYFSTCPSY